MTQRMRIGEVAELVGTTPRTIRYYESLGLLGPSEREGHGFRYYTEVEVARLKKIDTFKQLGLSLEEIGEILPLFCNDPTGLRAKQRLVEILEVHLHETDEKIVALRLFRTELQAQIDRVRDYIAQNTPSL